MRPNVYVGECIFACQCAYGGHRIPLCGILPQLQHALFFETVSPSLAQASPSRLAQLISKDPGSKSPKLPSTKLHQQCSGNLSYSLMLVKSTLLVCLFHHSSSCLF